MKNSRRWRLSTVIEQYSVCDRAINFERLCFDISFELIFRNGAPTWKIRINFHAMDRIDPIPWEERIESLFFRRIFFITLADRYLVSY